MINWTAGLNPEQSEAVLHDTGPLLILAGAGSGKTTVLVSRTGHLLESGAVKAREMCVLTFTNKAAREVKHRVAAKLGAAGARLTEQAQELWTGTFHAFGLQILRQNAKAAGLPSSFGVLGQSDATALLKELMGSIRNSGKDAFRVEKLLAMLSQWREKGQTRAQSDDEYEIMAEVLLPKYLKRLETLGVTDFDGLLLKPLKLFQDQPQILGRLQERFQRVMVDEFQDTNVTQFQLVLGLSQKHENLAVVGDDDQSIYGWRGACVSNILDFPKRYKNCRVIRLERNYRSTPAILSLANQVIEKNKNRHGKVLRSDPHASHGSKPECFVYDTDDLEAEEVIRHIRHFKDQGYAASDIAVLYRSNGQGGLLESQLRQNQIAYAITGGTGFFDRKETRDVMAYLRCALNPNEVAFRRIINTPARGIGDTTVERIAEFANTHAIGFVVASRRWREAGITDKIGTGLDELHALLAKLPEAILGVPGPVSGSAASGSSETAAGGIGYGAKTGNNLVRLFDEIGYRSYIRNQCKDHESFNKRWGVIEIFGRVLDSFVDRGGASRKTLLEFLDAMELRDADNDDDDKIPKVQLLTLHASKGLEFPVVILIGVEEDLLPHRTLGSDVSEERRLFYVGVTRAKEHLLLTRARTRQRYGRAVPVAPSRFLVEIPSASMTMHESGYRPVLEDQRKSLLADFMQSLDGKIASQKIDVKAGAGGKPPARA